MNAFDEFNVNEEAAPASHDAFESLVLHARRMHRRARATERHAEPHEMRSLRRRAVYSMIPRLDRALSNRVRQLALIGPHSRAARARRAETSRALGGERRRRWTNAVSACRIRMRPRALPFPRARRRSETSDGSRRFGSVSLEVTFTEVKSARSFFGDK
jgi:hypothetical protein